MSSRTQCIPKNSLYAATITVQSLQKHTPSGEPPVIACMKYIIAPKRVKDARLRLLPHRYDVEDTHLLCTCCKEYVGVHLATFLEAMKDGGLIYSPPIIPGIYVYSLIACARLPQSFSY